MSKRDYYEVLGVSRSVSAAELKKAYRRLAMQHHPDRNEGDMQAEKSFKEAKEAYEVLNDPQKRSAYDQFGHAGVDATTGGGAGGSGGAGFGDMFGDIFGDIFGATGGHGGRRQAKGADLRYNLELELEDAVKGTEVEVKVPTLKSCKTCSGSGARPGTSPATCGTCHGQGQVRMQQGFFSVQQTCPKCRGKGQEIKSPCISCNGHGRTRNSKTLSVKVPAGVDEGDQIRLSGEGEAGPGGAASGDLYVRVSIKEHGIFTRDGDDLYCELPVSFSAVVLGGSLEIPTLDGRANLKIPAETQSERVFRLRSKGVRNVRNGHQGDLYCKVTVETPVKLTKKQKDLLRQFEESLGEGGDRHCPRSSSWTGRLKMFFDDLVA